MRKSQKWQVGFALILAAFGATETRAAGKPAQQELTFTIYVHNYARVDGKTLAGAEHVAAGIFRKTEVETRWVDAPAVSNTFPVDSTETESNALTNLRVYILPQQMAERLGMPDNVMGLAPGRGSNRLLVYVFYQWLNQLAHREVRDQMEGTIPRRATVSQILGAMMAHELGHILLNLPSHSETGIMKGDWDLKELCDAGYGLLLFTRQQAEVIQMDVTRRNRQQASVAESANLASIF
jgi:hypothetical protein